MQVGKLAMHIFQAQSLLHTEVCSKNINSFLVLISDLFLCCWRYYSNCTGNYDFYRKSFSACNLSYFTTNNAISIAQNFTNFMLDMTICTKRKQSINECKAIILSCYRNANTEQRLACTLLSSPQRLLILCFIVTV